MYCIMIGFASGLCQDMITQVNLLGAFAMAKSISGYALGSLYNFEKIWIKRMKYGYILSIYILHNSIYYYLKLFSIADFPSAAKVILLQSFISLALLEAINIIIYDRKLIK